MNSLVSVITPCYNQAIYLKDALESVLTQTYINWECIIVNDGSLDNTEEIALQYCEKDSRFKYVKKENGGLSSARNAGILNSSGNYILPLDADDIIAPFYLDKAVNILKERTEVKIVYGNAKLFGEETGTFNLKPYSFQQLLLQNSIYCSAVYRRKDFDAVGGYWEELKYGLEDWEFWINILQFGGDVVKLEEFVFFYRRTNQSMIKNITDYAQKFSYDMILKRHLDLYLEYWDNPIRVYRNANYLRDELDAINKSNTYKLTKKIVSIKKIFYK